MNSELHPKISTIIDQFVRQVQQARPGLLEGFYLYGSIVLGDYSLALSDIDFIAVTKERLTPEEIALIGTIHKAVERAYPKPNLSGIYLTWADLGKLPGDVVPFPYFHDGRMVAAGYFELNLVTWHELLTYGMTMIGPDARTLSFAVDWTQLISRMHDNLHAYWTKWIQKRRSFSLPSMWMMVSRTDVEWGVLGITRLYYTFREQAITTKAGAGEYALQALPKRWHRIIREAIRVRRGERTLYWSGIRRKADALGYMAFIMQECERMR